MSNSIHVLISSAGESEAGGTFGGECILFDEIAAANKFTEMIAACDAFIKDQIDRINSVEEMREYVLTANGPSYGYFYDVYWLEFPTTTSVRHTVKDLINLYVCNDEEGNERSDIHKYLHDYSGHHLRSDAIYELFNMYC